MTFFLLLVACGPLWSVDEADVNRTATHETGYYWYGWDEDGDGYTESDGDCDDDNPDVNPAAEEWCDGNDNDCNGDVDEGVGTRSFEDADGDGFGNPDESWVECEPSGGVANDQDCDDEDRSAYPDAPEICDGVDNDCDTAVDEGPWAYSADAAWDTTGVTVTITGGCGSYDLGIAETGAGDAGWYGEACDAVDPDETGASICHPLLATGGRLETTTTQAELGDSTTLFGAADEGALTYVLRSDDGTCVAWGDLVDWYAALDCTPG